MLFDGTGININNVYQFNRNIQYLFQNNEDDQ